MNSSWISSFYTTARGLALLGSLLTVPSHAQMTKEPLYDIEIKRGIVYGNGLVKDNGKEVSRDLWMDAYLPTGTDGLRPTVIYTHGGAFHHGSPRTGYVVEGAQSSSPVDYCRLFAGLGYACFAIRYRLGPEDPIASGEGYSEDQINRESITLMLDRVNVIRAGLGLGPLDAANPEDQKSLSDTVLAAAEDLRGALDYIVKNATSFQVDPDRIVVGGFSAGAVTSLNIAHGMHAPVAGVFMLSGGPVGFDVYKTVTVTSKNAPALLFVGQYDLSGAILAAPSFVSHYSKVGVDLTFAWVAGFGHFYPSGAISLAADGTRKSVEKRIVEFVSRVTKK